MYYLILSKYFQISLKNIHSVETDLDFSIIDKVTFFYDDSLSTNVHVVNDITFKLKVSSDKNKGAWVIILQSKMFQEFILYLWINV